MRKHSPYAALSGFLAVALVAVLVLGFAGVFDGNGNGSSTSSSSATAPAAPAGPLGRDASVADIYQQVSKGVVQVNVRSGAGGGTGSGFVIDKDGRILTNQHVVEDAQKVQVQFGPNQDPIDAQVLGSDPSSDLAVLKVKPDDVKGGLKPLALADSSKLRVGEPTIAIGSPFGLEGSLTTGVVSALERTVQSPNGFPISGVVQTDAAINPGNSGGPLLDGQGRVIGINAQIAAGASRSNSGVGFAIAINTAKKVVPSLERGDQIKRAYLGVSTAEVTADLARQLNLGTSDGVLVASVVAGGPAANAGVRPAGPTGRGGDVIVAVNGRAVKASDDVSVAIASLKPGDKARLDVLRSGAKKTLTITLGNRPSQSPSLP